MNETLKLYALEDLTSTAAPYFNEYVRQYLMNKYGSEKVLSDGYKVTTTLKLKYQKNAEKVLERGLRIVDKRLGWRGIQKNLAVNDREPFLTASHDEIVEKITRVRLLPPLTDAVVKKLPYDLSFLQEKNTPYFGATPIREGQFYKSIITSVDDVKNVAIARIGMTSVVLPFSTMDWVKINDKAPKKVSEILREGDVAEVKVEKIDRKDSLVIATLEQEPELQGALLSYDLTSGEVLAMVGGRDFAKSKFNRALQAKRQVGSTFKPIIYAAAMDRGFSPSSIVTDSPLIFKHEEQLDADNQGEDWRPRNYSGKFEGDIPLRLALILKPLNPLNPKTTES
jgi:penicillin-binding protein 1A